MESFLSSLKKLNLKSKIARLDNQLERVASDMETIDEGSFAKELCKEALELLKMQREKYAREARRFAKRLGVICEFFDGNEQPGDDEDDDIVSEDDGAAAGQAGGAVAGQAGGAVAGQAGGAVAGQAAGAVAGQAAGAHLDVTDLEGAGLWKTRPELCALFEEAVLALGKGNIHPKDILKIMKESGVVGLTQSKVLGRLRARRIATGSRHPASIYY